MNKTGISTGELEVNDDNAIDCDNKRIAIALYNGSNEECHANAKLIAEAGTVTNECGKTPRELLSENKELLKSLIYVTGMLSRRINEIELLDVERMIMDEIRDVVKKSTE